MPSSAKSKSKFVKPSSSSALPSPSSEPSSTFSFLLAIIGVILVALGVVWLLAQNWHQIPDGVKVAILCGATTGILLVGVHLQKKLYVNLGHAVYLLSAFLYTLSIFLIAQIFFTPTGLQGTAWLFLMCWVGVVVVAYLLQTVPALLLGLVEFTVWLVLQFFAWSELGGHGADFNIPVIGWLVALLLFAGVLFFALRVMHAGRRFEKVYLWWVVFYFLLFAYLLSFQKLLPVFWPYGLSFDITAPYVLLAGALAIALFAYALFATPLLRTQGAWFGGFAALLCLFLFSLPVWVPTQYSEASRWECTQRSCWDSSQVQCVSRPDCAWLESAGSLDDGLGARCGDLTERCYRMQGNKTACDSMNGCRWVDENYCTSSEAVVRSDCSSLVRGTFADWKPVCEANPSCTVSERYFDPWNYSLSFGQWFAWILANLLFLTTILLVLWYGTMTRYAAMVNVGIAFFVLGVITRYIGFIMDLWGYTSLSIIFIIGGVLLIVGGWLIERWRRKLLSKTK